jgi:hypothetical protein
MPSRKRQPTGRRNHEQIEPFGNTATSNANNRKNAPTEPNGAHARHLVSNFCEHWTERQTSHKTEQLFNEPSFRILHHANSRGKPFYY